MKKNSSSSTFAVYNFKKNHKFLFSILIFSVFLYISPELYAQKTFSPNNQKVWSVDSELYKNMCTLFLLEGLGLPSTSGPWSTAELQLWFSKIDSSTLSETSSRLYEKIEETLYETPHFVFDQSLGFDYENTLNPELYFHTNPENFSTESDWVYDYETRNPLFDCNLDLLAANYFYANLNFPLAWASYGDSTATENPIYGSSFMSNIPYLPHKNLSSLSVNFPDRAITAVGANHWSFSAGRDIYRWGAGQTGNMAVGGNALYDNGIRFSLFYPYFKFNFITIIYPHDSSILSDDANERHYSQNDTIDGIKLFMAHRIEGRFFKDRLNLSLAEAIMYQSASSTFDIRFLNPVGIYHNYYIRGNANSFMNIDADFTIFKGFNIYTQFLLDELAFLGEPSGQTDDPWRPNKVGLMVGTKYQIPLFNGILKLSLEGVYADPCLYLREEYDSEDQTQGVSFYGHLREFGNGYEITYIRNCVGYKYGGDCITGDFFAEYDSLDKLKIQMELFYLAHGIMYYPLKTDWVIGKNQLAPSKSDPTIDPSNADGEIEYTFRASFGAEYQLFKTLSINAGIDNWFIWNKDNISKNLVYDCQIHAGIKKIFN